MKGGNFWRSRKKPRNYVTDPTCKSKQRFTDQVGAMAGALVTMQERGEGRRVLWVYRCKHCFGWHMTSKIGPQQLRVIVEREKKAA